MTEPERRQTSEPSKPPHGSLARMLLQWMMRPGGIAAVETLSSRFRWITLEGDALTGVDWTMDQKIQLAMGSGLSARTYTPMSWDATHGRTRLLAFAHGNGPAVVFEHDPFGKPLHTFPDHALGLPPRQRQCASCPHGHREQLS